MQPSLRNRPRSWFLVFALTSLLPVGLGACGAPEDGDLAAPAGPPTADTLDATIRSYALANQQKLEAGGFTLLGRVWVASDGYGEIYRDPTGGSAGFIVARGNGAEAGRPELAPRPAEPFAAYVARVAGANGVGATYIDLPGNTAGLNAVAFTPVPGREQGVFVSALTNERCPKTRFDAQCRTHYAYRGSSLVSSWNIVDQFARQSFAGTGASYDTFVCADRTDATLTVVPNNNSFTRVTVDIPEGWSAGAWAAGAYTEREVCLAKFIICLDWQWQIRFPRAAFTISAQSRAGGNYHFCGAIWNTPDRNREDDAFGSCQDHLDCPFIDDSVTFGRNVCRNVCAANCAQSCAGAGPGAAACNAACGSSCASGC